jgi:hypothetical protein
MITAVSVSGHTSLLECSLGSQFCKFSSKSSSALDEDI